MITYRAMTCGIALYMTCADNWISPPNPVNLTMKTNATSRLSVGQTIQFNCTANNFSGTLAFFRVVGNTETRERAGYSGFTHSITLTEDDNGSEWYCGTYFSRTVQQPVGPRIEYFYTRSNKFRISLEGVTKRAKPPSRDGQDVKLKMITSSKKFNLSDTVSWLCEAENVSHGFMQMIQGKGNIERNIYVGYQISGGYRWIDQTFTPGDNDTYIYCAIYIYEFERRIGYSIKGERTYLKF